MDMDWATDMDKDMGTDMDMEKDMGEIFCLLTNKSSERVKIPKMAPKKYCNSIIHEFSWKFIAMTDKLCRNERKVLPLKHPQM